MLEIEEHIDKACHPAGLGQGVKQLVGPCNEIGFYPDAQRQNERIAIADVVAQDRSRDTGFLGDALQGRPLDTVACDASGKGIENFLGSLLLEAWASQGD